MIIYEVEVSTWDYVMEDETYRNALFSTREKAEKYAKHEKEVYLKLGWKEGEVPKNSRDHIYLVSETDNCAIYINERKVDEEEV